MKKNIIVVGAGLSGLASAFYLAKKGYNVSIYEKNHVAGGFVTGWYRKNQYIDGCIHWLIGTKNGTNINKIWKDLGVLDQNIVINPDSFYSVEYEGQTLTFYADYDKLEEELYRVNQGDDDKIKQLMEALRKTGVYEMPASVPYELNDGQELKAQSQLFFSMRKFTMTSLEAYANSFNTPIIKYALLHGLIEPSFSAFYFVQTLSNICQGNGSLVKYGSSYVIESIVKRLKENNVNIYYNSPVEKILIEDGKAKGIRVNGNDILSDYVISSCDMYFTFDKLLDIELPESYKKLSENKEANITYSFVVASYKTKNSFKNKHIATVYKVSDYNILDRTYDELSVRYYNYDDELITDGYTTVEVFIPTREKEYDYLSKMTKDEYKNYKNHMLDVITSKLNEIHPDTEFISLDILTPLTYQRYMNAYKGTFMTYTLSARSKQFIHSLKLDGVDNLVFANQWLTRPGGTCVAITNGKFAAQYVMYLDGQDYKI